MEWACQNWKFRFKKKPQKIQKQIGYLPENNPLYPEMFVREYLMYVGRLYQIKNPNIEEVIEKTGLSGHQSKKLTFYLKDSNSV